MKRSSEAGQLDHLVVNDMVVQEQICNLSCAYCLTPTTNAVRSRRSANDIAERVRRASRVGLELRALVLKLSGGEVTQIKGLAEALPDLANGYETLALLTNGTSLDRRWFQALRSFPNALIQVSIDSVSLAGNALRTRSATMHRRILSNIDASLQWGIPVEVYLVLTTESVASLESTIKYFEERRGDLIVYPFPVRGPARDCFLPSETLRQALARDLRAWRSDVLPDKAYIQRLADFLITGRRTVACHLPRIAFGSFDDGTITTCPNHWFDRFDPSEAPAAYAEQLGKARFRPLLLNRSPRFAACRYCLTPWDSVCAFLDGEIDLDSLSRSAMYRGSRTRAKLSSLRTRLLHRRPEP